MPLRNYYILLLTLIVGGLCYVQARRTRSAMVVADAIDKIETFYVDRIEHRELVEAALAGLESELDAHSQYIPPASLEQFEVFLHQQFAGIGVLVEQPDEAQPVRVITPLVASPALRAGILPGDLIVAVDGEDVTAMKLDEVSDRLKGLPGTTVRITLRREIDDAAQPPESSEESTTDGEPMPSDPPGDDGGGATATELVQVEVTRGQIALDSVVGYSRDEKSDWVFRLPADPRIAYLRCTSFGEKTVGEIAAALDALDGDYDALVLDLRGNAGGLLNAAVEICDMFLHSGEIVSTRGRDRSRKASSERATPGVLVDDDVPVAVLVNGNSASASEIVAACLQDHGRAVVVGTRSFGKGTVQNVLPMEYGRSALKLTTARYYRPSGRNIHRVEDASDEDEWGVTPDAGMEVEMSDDELEAVARRWRRATYPMWKDREVTSLSDQEEFDDLVRELTDAPEKEEPRDEAPEDDADPAEDDDAAKSQDDAAESEADQGAGDDRGDEVDEDDFQRIVDPQLKRAVEVLQEQLAAATPRAEAA